MALSSILESMYVLRPWIHGEFMFTMKDWLDLQVKNTMLRTSSQINLHILLIIQSTRRVKLLCRIKVQIRVT